MQNRENYKSNSYKRDFKIIIEFMNLTLLPPLYNFPLQIQHTNIHSIEIFLKKDFVYLFLERREGKEKERERKFNV